MLKEPGSVVVTRSTSNTCTQINIFPKISNYSFMFVHWLQRDPVKFPKTDEMKCQQLCMCKEFLPRVFRESCAVRMKLRAAVSKNAKRIESQSLSLRINSTTFLNSRYGFNVSG